MVPTIIFTANDERVEVPLGIGRLEEFRRWVASETSPDRGRFDYIDQRVEVDMSPEDLFTHGIVKTEISRVLTNRVRDRDLGYVFSDRTRVSVPAAELSVEPDVVVLSHAAIDAGRVRLVSKAGAADRYSEMEGPPELVVEIVSDASFAKDTRVLPRRYYAAGIPEFWLVDARTEPLTFQIFEPAPAEYRAARTEDQWQFSSVLQQWYRLVRQIDRRGRPHFTLLEK